MATMFEYRLLCLSRHGRDVFDTPIPSIVGALGIWRLQLENPVDFVRRVMHIVFMYKAISV